MCSRRDCITRQQSTRFPVLFSFIHRNQLHSRTGAPGRVVDLSSTVDLKGIPQDDYVIRLQQSIGDEKGIFYTDANGLLVG